MKKITQILTFLGVVAFAMSMGVSSSFAKSPKANVKCEAIFLGPINSVKDAERLAEAHALKLIEKGSLTGGADYFILPVPVGSASYTKDSFYAMDCKFKGWTE